MSRYYLEEVGSTPEQQAILEYGLKEGETAKWLDEMFDDLGETSDTVRTSYGYENMVYDPDKVIFY